MGVVQLTLTDLLPPPALDIIEVWMPATAPPGGAWVEVTVTERTPWWIKGYHVWKHGNMCGTRTIWIWPGDKGRLWRETVDNPPGYYRSGGQTDDD